MGENRPIVVVDTNCLNAEKSYSILFGNRGELKSIAEVADLLIPAVVVDEAINHKRRSFAQDVSRIRGSQVLQLGGIDTGSLALPDFDTIEVSLRKDQSIPYSVIKPRDEGAAFEKLYDLAIQNKAPFEEKSDKGFKDGCIAVSIDDYLEDNPGSCLYLLTEDVRLASYFSKNERVTRISSYKELLSAIRPDSMGGSAASNESTVAASKDNGSTSPMTDPRIREALIGLASELGSSKSFADTHSIIKKIRSLQGQVGRAEGVDLLRAAVHNDQVYAILKDQDVWDCLYPLFEDFKSELDNEEYGTFVEYGDLPYERDDDPLNVHFTQSERMAFRRVVDCIGDHLSEVGAMASVRSANEIVSNLRHVLSRNQLGSLISCRELIAAVIDGHFNSYEGSLPTETLRKFLDYYERAGDIKRDAVISALVNKVSSADVDFSDLPF